MQNVANFLEQVGRNSKENVMPCFRKGGELLYTFGRSPSEWHVFGFGGREVLYAMTKEWVDGYPCMPEKRDVAEIWGYCHIEEDPKFYRNEKKVIVFEPIPRDAPEREILRRELSKFHRKAVFRGEQEELSRQRNLEREREAMQCPKGGEHVWAHAECYDAYGEIYTLTCGKCGENQTTFDWQMATKIQVRNLGMETARLEIECAVSGCPPQVEKLISEAKKATGEALRIAEENS